MPQTEGDLYKGYVLGLLIMEICQIPSNRIIVSIRKVYDIVDNIIIYAVDTYVVGQSLNVDNKISYSTTTEELDRLIANKRIKKLSKIK